MYISDLPAARLDTVSIPAFTPSAQRQWWPQRLVTTLTHWNAAGTHRLDAHLASDTGFETYAVE